MPVTELQVNFIYVAHFIWHVYFMYFSTKQKKKKKYKAKIIHDRNI